MTNPLKYTLQGNTHSPPPVWFMRQAGRYLPEYQAIRKKLPHFMDLCFHEDCATEVTLQPLRRFDLDAAILFSDILVIPYVLGQPVHFIEKTGPVLGPIESSFLKRAKGINIPEALSIPLKILQNVRKALPSTKAVIGFAGSPWTIATYMFEQGKSTNFSKINHLLMNKDPLFCQIMALLEKAVGAFLIEQIKAGADAVQIFDSWAKAVPFEFREEWVVFPIRRIVARIRNDHPHTPLIYYGRGVSDLYPQIISGFSHMALGVDEEIPIPVMKHTLQKLAPLQGNLSPHLLVEGGKQMEKKAQELLEVFQGTPYVFNLGHGILPQTPVGHVAHLVDIVKESNFPQ